MSGSYFCTWIIGPENVSGTSRSVHNGYRKEQKKRSRGMFMLDETMFVISLSIFWLITTRNDRMLLSVMIASFLFFICTKQQAQPENAWWGLMNEHWVWQNLLIVCFDRRHEKGRLFIISCQAKSRGLHFFRWYLLICENAPNTRRALAPAVVLRLPYLKVQNI